MFPYQLPQPPQNCERSLPGLRPEGAVAVCFFMQALPILKNQFLVLWLRDSIGLNGMSRTALQQPSV